MTAAPTTSATPSKNSDGFNFTPVIVYGAIYLLLIVVWAYTLLTGSVTMQPMDWVRKAYPNWNTQGIEGEPATSSKLWQEVNFTSPDGVSYRFEASERLTRGMAIALARTITQAKERATPSSTTTSDSTRFPYDSLTFYKDSLLANLPWPYLFTLFNLIGLFAALYLALKTPIRDMVQNGAKEAKEQLAHAAKARTEAEALRKQFDQLAVDVQQERERLAVSAKEEQALEKKRILDLANHEAEGVIDSLRASLEAEKKKVVSDLKDRAVKDALMKAREALESRMAKQEDAVIDQVVTSISQAEV